jgi:serine phosphatase RsbU (regulator of sigma subunit)
MLEGLVLEERRVSLAAGDLLVAYSDGIPDAVNADVDDYGLERLIALLDRNRSQPVAEVCQAVFDDVFAFRGAAPAFDDITVLVVRCEAPAANAPEAA